ncbi:MAG TPA: ABC transporter permease [Ktedonobacterales bacterium]|jgi:ABC-type dipeptide/oligopeptide/nickel transport system permease component
MKREKGHFVVQVLVKRLVGLIFVVLAITFVTFMLGYIAPGDPIRLLLGQHFNPTVYALLRHKYGLDLPWYQQYGTFLLNLLHFNLGLSFTQTNRPVWDVLKEGVPISVELGFWALVIEFLVGIPLGVLSATRANTWVDTLNTGTLLIVYTIPSFITCVFVQVLLVWLDQKFNLGWPVAGWGAPWQYDWSDLEYKIAPILILSLGGIAYVARFTRSNLLEVLHQDYIRTVRSKGLSERVVIYRHALRNALIPLVTLLGLSLGLLVTGAFFIEFIFNIPGIANITIRSVTAYDYPVIQATAILLALGVVLGNLLSDFLYSLVDPRISFA